MESVDLVRCSNCVLDNSEPTIVFDEKGVCRFCNDYFALGDVISAESDIERKIKLDTIVNQIKAEGRDKEYDCIIGLSGGVDSSYVSYIVKQQGLRPLAIHLDNGWNAELAVKNIENICTKLNIDLHTHVINWEEFRDLQLSFLKASVRNTEAPTDHAIFAILHKMARKYGIRWIIDGVNQATEYVRSGSEAGGYAYSDLKQIYGIHRRFGKIKLSTYPSMSYWQKLYYKHFVKIQQFSILDYVEYNKEDALQLLSKELGWRSYGAKHHESLFTKWHQAVYLIEKFGYDKRKAHLSDLILSGQISRDMALKELNNPVLKENDRIDLEDYLKKKLCLSEDEYQRILKDQPRSHKEFPNDEWVIKLYAFVKQYIDV